MNRKSLGLGNIPVELNGEKSPAEWNKALIFSIFKKENGSNWTN